MSRTAFAYARYSSHNQKEESIEQQLDEINSFAKENHINIIETFFDAAMSGRNDRRPQFQRMLRAARRQPPDIIIAYKSNRISRNMLNALATENELEKIGVKVLYVKETFGDNAAGRFALRTMMNVNQFYSENMAEDIKRGLMDNAAECKVNGSIPLGYIRGADGKHAIDPVTAPIVREIFQRYAAGERVSEIARALNDRGITSVKGHRWRGSKLLPILRNQSYIGNYHYADVVVEGGMPAIIKKEEWNIVQELLDNKDRASKHGPRSDYLLTGKLFCGHCGARMNGVSGNSQSGISYYYYKCRTRHTGGDCKKENVPRDWLENIVITETVKRVLSPEIIEAIANITIQYQDELLKQSNISALEKKLSETNKAIKNIMSAIEAGIFTDSTKERLQELEAEKIKIKQSIEKERPKLNPVTKDQVIYWLTKLKNGDINDRNYQKLLVNNFINAIYLYDDKIKILYSHDRTKQPIKIPITKEDAAQPPRTITILLHQKVFSILRRLFSFIHRKKFSYAI